MKLYRDPTDPRELDFKGLGEKNTEATGHNLDTETGPSLRDEFMRPGALVSHDQWLADICANRHKGNPESESANRRVDKLKARERVLAAIMTLHEATCEQVEHQTGLSHQTASARIFRVET